MGIALLFCTKLGTGLTNYPASYMAYLFPAWTSIVGFVLGAFVGSFLNMAIYRLPRGLSFIEPSRSFCPTCKHPLYTVDLMPMFSWLSTKGKCRYCREPVASRYFWVELLTASLFGGIWFCYLSTNYSPLQAGFYMLFAACLVAVIFIDWELYIIPDELNALLLILAFTYRALDHSIPDALWGALLGWGILFGIQLLGRIGFRKDAMGDGDIKMMRGVGAILGPWLLVGNMAIAVIAGLVGGLIGIAMAKKVPVPEVTEGEATDDSFPPPTPIPFVFLAGAWYFLCLDIVALFIPALGKWIESKLPQEIVEEGDDWTPSPTAIPFGPYLALGALICMIFATPIEHGLKGYFHIPAEVSTAESPR